MWRLAVCMTSWSSAQHQVATVCAGKRLSIDRQQQTGSMESGSGASLSKASPVSSLSRPLQSVRHCLTGCNLLAALSRGPAAASEPVSGCWLCWRCSPAF